MTGEKKAVIDGTEQKESFTCKKDKQELKESLERVLDGETLYHKITELYDDGEEPVEWSSYQLSQKRNNDFVISLIFNETGRLKTNTDKRVQYFLLETESGLGIYLVVKNDKGYIEIRTRISHQDLFGDMVNRGRGIL